jgi:glutamyl endopeptidase
MTQKRLLGGFVMVRYSFQRLVMCGLTLALTLAGVSRAGDLSSPEISLTRAQIAQARSQATMFDTAAAILGAGGIAKPQVDAAASPLPTLGDRVSMASQQMVADAKVSVSEFVARVSGNKLTPSVIVGRDDRTRVSNTTAVPFRGICNLVVTWKNGRVSTGTGFFAGRRVLLTNGHMVYNAANGGWYKSIQVIPGRNGSQTPYGWQYASQAFTTNGFISNSQRGYNSACIDFDIAWVALPDATLFNRVGYAFGYETNSDATLRSLGLNLAGYHGDKNGEQWHTFGGGNQIVSAMSFRHFLDMVPGASGSPMWRYDAARGQRFAVGVNAAESVSIATNYACRMTTAYFNTTGQMNSNFR